MGGERCAGISLCDAIAIHDRRREGEGGVLRMVMAGGGGYVGGELGTGWGAGWGGGGKGVEIGERRAGYRRGCWGGRGEVRVLRLVEGVLGTGKGAGGGRGEVRVWR